MLIKVSRNQDSTLCQEVERIDENTTTLGFPYLKNITKTNQVTDNDALNWLYPNGNISYQETIYVLIMKALIDGMQLFKG